MGMSQETAQVRLTQTPSWETMGHKQNSRPFRRARRKPLVTHSQFHQGLGGQRRTPALLGVAANASVPSSTTSRSPIPPKQMSLPRPHLGMSIPCLSSNLPPHPPPPHTPGSLPPQSIRRVLLILPDQEEITDPVFESPLCGLGTPRGTAPLPFLIPYSVFLQRFLSAQTE